MKSKKKKNSKKTSPGLLVNVARTIGTTLGTLAAKTGTVKTPSTRPVRAKKKPARAAKPTRPRHGA